jgi:purine-binding chemotaxis protein CheW
VLQIDEVLIIDISDTLYGINTEYIHYILKVVNITPVPYSNRAIRGLCAIEGGVKPLFDLSVLIGREPINIENPKARILVIDSGKSSFFLLVDGVINNIEIQQDRIEYIEERDSSTTALYKFDEDIVQILELNFLMSSLRLSLQDNSLVSIKETQTQFVRNSEPDSDEQSRRFLLFKMRDEKFAIQIDNVREVINIPDEFIDLAETSEEVIGMFSLRDELIVVIDFRIHFSFDAIKSDKNRIIIAQYKSKVVSFIVDELINIIDIPMNTVKKFPDNFENSMLEGIAEIGDSLISIIDEVEIDKIIKTNHHIIDQTFTKMANSIAKENNPDIEVVIFSLGSDDYAFNINSVFEIIDFEEEQLTEIPNVSNFIKGLMNVRGKVMPIVSLHQQLGISESGDNGGKRIVVITHQEKFIGFIVDRVVDIRNIFASEIKRDEEKESFFAEVLELSEEKRIVLLFNTDYLFSEEINYIEDRYCSISFQHQL